MGKKEEIASIFYDIADILEMQNVKWKPQAYTIAARALEDLKEPVENIYKKKGLKGLEDIPGIGEALAKKIVEYLKTGKIKRYEELKKSVSSGMIEMMKIPGLGPKRVKLLHDELEIENIEQLEKAAKQGKIRDLPTFKKTSERNILEGIRRYKSGRERIPLETALKESNRILKILKKVSGVKRTSEAGSVRRRLETIGDLDLLVSSSKPEKVINRFIKLNGIKKILAKGKTKASVVLNNNLQIDLRVIPDDEFGAALQYFTGNKAHNILLRKIAIKKGYKLNEYGLFKGKKKVAGKTEKEVYDKLGVKIPNPKDRIGEDELKKK